MNATVCNSKQKWNHNEFQCGCKELDDWGSWENDYMRNLSTCHCECNKACKTHVHLDIKNCSCEKRLIGKLALLSDKKVSCAKSNCLIHTIYLVIICLLLLIVFVLGVIFIMQNIDKNKNIYYHLTIPSLN